jgi:hypothetical protein
VDIKLSTSFCVYATTLQHVTCYIVEKAYTTDIISEYMIATKRTLTKPLGWEPMKEFEFREIFFKYPFKESFTRQFLYDDENIKEGVFNCKLFELKHKFIEDIGIAIADDWKNDRIKFFRYGSKLKWDSFEIKNNKK